jgi:hypothetical protein
MDGLPANDATECVRVLRGELLRFLDGVGVVYEPRTDAIEERSSCGQATLIEQAVQISPMCGLDRRISIGCGM